MKTEHTAGKTLEARAARRGMAIISVLLVMMVMLGLAGAFFAAHRSDLALMSAAGYREETKNACLSVADFVQYKLQNDRRFGMARFSLSGDAPAPEVFPADSSQPVLEVEYIGVRQRGETRNFLRGRFPESEVTFEVELLNNLEGYTELQLPSRQFDDLLRTAPPRTARAWVTARRGNVAHGIDLIFKRSPFTNASITAGKDIEVQLTNTDNGQWLLGARQPSGNSVRAGGSVIGPEVWSPTGRSVLFTPPTGMEAVLRPPYGVIQGEQLTMQVDGVPTRLEAGEETTREAEANIQGVLSPGGGAVKVPDLRRQDLQGAARRVTLPRGDLTFVSEQGAGGGVRHVLKSGSQILAEYDPASSPYEDRHFTWPDLEGLVEIDLESRQVRVAENVELTTDGAFALRSETRDRQPDPSRQPRLLLGSAAQGAAVDAGSIDVEGSVAGMGALKSRSDLKVAAKTYLSTTPDFGIALHAEGDVVLTRPGSGVGDGLAVDWDAFAKGYELSGTRKEQLDRWGGLSQEDRDAEAARFQTRVLAESGDPEAFEALWAGLTADLPADAAALAQRDRWLAAEVPPVPPVMGPDPDWTPTAEQAEPPQIEITPGVPGVPAGGGITVGRYLRLREYLRTVNGDAPNPDPSWLGEGDPDRVAARQAEVRAMVANQLSAYQLVAGQTSKDVNGQVVLEWRPLGEFFQGSNPFLASYTPDLVFRGLVYAGKDFIFKTDKMGVYVEGALVAKGNVTIENATGAHFVYNSDLLENLFATDMEDTSVPLERAYWAFY